MRSWLVLVTLAACASDPTLEVVVQHPDGLAVASTDVTVYESATLTCQDIEFGLLDDVQLVALATADETISPGGAVTGNLDGISRTNNKVIVARGYNTSGDVVAAGCVQKALVSGADSVTITTVVAATVAIAPPADATTLTTTVTATDPDGAVIDGRPISWTVYGPAGSVPSSISNITVTSDGVWEPTMPTCTSQGVAQVHVAPPGSVGGYAVQMRVAWATSLPPIFTNLTNADFALQSLPVAPPVTAKKYCAIRHSGTTQRLDCFDGTFLATDYAVSVSGNRASLTAMGTQSLSIDTIALISVPIGNDLDVYAIDDNGDLAALFGAPPPTNTGSAMKCGVGSKCIGDVMVVPPCGSSAAGRIFILTNAEIVKSLDYTGALGTQFAAPGLSAAFDNAGCITQLGTSGSPTLVQAASIFSEGAAVGSSLDTPDVHLVACSNTGCEVLPNTLTRGAAVGFTSGTEPRMIATSVDATGVVLLQVVLSSTNGTIERSRMPAAAVPARIVTGQLDTDGDPDVLWDIASRQGASFEVAYARTVGSEPLEALSPATTATIDDLLAGDLTGDGLDDVVVLGSDGTTTGFALVPMGVSAPTSVQTDPPCAP